MESKKEKMTWKGVVEDTILALQHSLVNNSKVSKKYFEMISVLLQPDHIKTVQQYRNKLNRCGNVMCEEVMTSLSRKRVYCSNSCRMQSEHVEKSLDLLSPYRRFNLSVSEVLLFANQLSTFELTEESLTKLYHEELNRNQIMKNDIVLEEEPKQEPMDISSFYTSDSSVFPVPAETVVELPDEMRFFGTVWVNLSRWVTSSTNIFMHNNGKSSPSSSSTEKKDEKLRSSFTNWIPKVTKSVITEHDDQKKLEAILTKLVDTTFDLDDERVFHDLGEKHFKLIVLVMIMACVKQNIFEMKEEGGESFFVRTLKMCAEEYRLVEFRVSFILNLLINGT